MTTICFSGDGKTAFGMAKGAGIGWTRKSWTRFAERHGYVVKSSVTADVDFVVASRAAIQQMTGKVRTALKTQKCAVRYEDFYDFAKQPSR